MDEDSKKSRRGKATHDRIIEVAEGLIATHGPDGLQLQHVTEILGITPPAIYNHFKDREDLVARIAEKGARLLDERMRRKAGDDTLTSLRRNVRDYVAFLVEQPAYARIILWDVARRGTTEWRGMAASNIETRARMRRSFDRAAKAGEIRPIRLESYLQYVYIGAAAATVWTDEDPPAFPEASTSQSDANLPRPSPLESPPLIDPPRLSEAEVERLKDEAEALVVQLLSPN